MEENIDEVDEVENTESQEEITRPQNETDGDAKPEVNEMEFSDDEADGDEGNQENVDNSTDDVEATKPQENNTKTKKQQSKAENSLFAARRREQEAIAKKREDDAYKKGLAAALVGTTNQFTGEKIQDQDDIDEYLLMKDAEKAGFDPTTELSKYQKQKAKDDRKAKESKFDVNADITAFKEAYPNVNLSELVSDRDFGDFAEPFAQKVPLSTIYAQYVLMKSKVEVTAQTKAEEKYRRKISSPGSLVNNTQDKPLSYENMSDEEFEKYLQKAKRGDLMKS